MKRLNALPIVLFAVIALTSIVVAGPERMASSKEMQQTVAPEPECNWTGFYIGFNGGYGWTSFDTDIDPVGTTAISEFLPQNMDHDANGALFGGQLGYNHQWGWFVFGIEGDFDGANMSGSHQTSANSGRVPGLATDSFMTTDDTNWLATARARLGIAFGCNLLYVTGGGAWEDLTRKTTINAETAPGVFGSNASGSFDSTRGGFSVGGGWERMIGKHWTVRAEYLFYGLDDDDNDFVTFDRTALPGQSNANIHTDSNDVHTFRLGLNCKF